MASLTMTAEEVRKELGAFLSKPLSVGSGDLSTQQVFSATSMATGGLSGDFIIRQNGRILVVDDTTYRVVIGKLS